MKETEIIQEHARYRMALEAIVILGYASHNAKDIAQAALEGVAPTIKEELQYSPTTLRWPLSNPGPLA